jgi:lysyl-tRNA synthetase class 2
VVGKRVVNYQGQEINLNPPWKRVELRDAIIEKTGVDFTKHTDDKSLYDALQQAGFNPQAGAPWGKLIDAILGDLIEPTLMQPTFLYNYPREISPLAKNIPGNPAMVERFEGFVGGIELCNAFTELNDPVEQEKRFIEMGNMYAADDEERHPLDEDYLRAMAYGMPPNGGFGMGVDRLTMLLTDKHSIREVILFPHLREREDEK